MGPEIHFGSEQFIDEIAAAVGEDPVAFRLKYITAPRDAAVVKAAAEKAGWQPRRPRTGKRRGDVMRGRGIAYTQRNGTVVAVVAEVEVDRRDGRIWARKFTVAHDCGLIINPQGLRQTIEGNVVQGLSRTLFEEVQFDRDRVTSVDWATYPILEMQDAPETIDVVLIDRTDVAALRRGRADHARRAGRGRQRGLRCHRRAHPSHSDDTCAHKAALADNLKLRGCIHPRSVPVSRTLEGVPTACGASPAPENGIRRNVHAPSEALVPRLRHRAVDARA